MPTKLMPGILMFFLFILTGICSLYQINNNSILFQTDEAYWISTARIVPVLWKGRFNDPFWREYYGFTNFNGAKYIYGMGLFLMGHTESDIQQAGVAPQTYYKWRHVEGIFPQEYALYDTLHDARMISALFISLSVSLMMLLTFLIFGKISMGIAAGLLLYIHPITQYLATHAFSDGFLLFFILLSLIGIVHIFRNYSLGKSIHWKYSVFYGFIFAYIISIKINGALFLLAFILLTAYVFLSQPSQKQKTILIKTTASIMFFSCIFFLLLQPNLFFYPSYTLMQMLEDRVAITNYHVAYYTDTNPSHVIIPLYSRIRSLLTYSFPPWLILPFIGGLVYSFYAFIRTHHRKSSVIYGYMALVGFVILNGVLSYVVFDEIRYFLPILPFIILIAVSWMEYPDTVIKRYISSFGLY